MKVAKFMVIFAFVGFASQAYMHVKFEEYLWLIVDVPLTIYFGFTTIMMTITERYEDKRE